MLSICGGDVCNIDSVFASHRLLANRRVAAPANLLPSSATGGGRSRNYRLS